VNSDSPPAGRLQQRAAEIEATVRRAAARFGEVPVIETVTVRLLVLLGREISALLEQALRPHGLSETDFRTLMSLFSQPEGIANPSQLCASVAQSPANMTRVADALCERGLITRVACEQDRRRTILRITASGEALALALLPHMAAHTRALFDPMPLAERQQLLEQLRALVRQLDHSRLAELPGDHSGVR
jgi:MarR family transcriptional regulator, negative regulator of the multidrug operon emrRAB